MSASFRRADFAAGAARRPDLPPVAYEARAASPAPRFVRLDTGGFIGLAERGPAGTWRASPRWSRPGAAPCA